MARGFALQHHAFEWHQLVPHEARDQLLEHPVRLAGFKIHLPACADRGVLRMPCPCGGLLESRERPWLASDGTSVMCRRRHCRVLLVLRRTLNSDEALFRIELGSAR